jgi:hypothetical protein
MALTVRVARLDHIVAPITPAGRASGSRERRRRATRAVAPTKYTQTTSSGSVESEPTNTRTYLEAASYAPDSDSGWPKFVDSTNPR